MKIQRWKIEIAVALIALSATLYGIRWVLFPSPPLHNEMLRYLVDDVAFLFVQVLLTTMLIDRVFQRREREELHSKLNMLVGAFFTQTGTDLLGRLAVADANLPAVRDDLVPTAAWKPEDYRQARAAFEAHETTIDLSSCQLGALKDQLSAQKPYVLSLLSNQALLEHDTFSDLLWAVTHLAEELDARTSLEDLPPADRAHIAGDVKRAYTLLGAHWIEYLSHLQTNYPYLFSLAVRTNPLDDSAQVTVAG